MIRAGIKPAKATSGPAERAEPGGAGPSGSGPSRESARESRDVPAARRAPEQAVHPAGQTDRPTAHEPASGVEGRGEVPRLLTIPGPRSVSDAVESDQ